MGGVAVVQLVGNLLQRCAGEQVVASQCHPQLPDRLARACPELFVKFPFQLAYTQAACASQFRYIKAGAAQFILKRVVHLAGPVI